MDDWTDEELAKVCDLNHRIGQCWQRLQWTAKDFGRKSRYFYRAKADFTDLHNELADVYASLGLTSAKLLFEIL